MKNYKIPALLVSLSFLSFACAHYNIKRPSFINKASPSPTVDGLNLNAVPNTATQTSSAEANTLPTPIKDAMNPDPLMGPGLITSPVPGVVVTPLVPTQPLSPVLPEVWPTPPSAPVHVQSYEEAIQAIDAAKDKDENLKNFWVGGGYDVLTGARTPTCLDPSSLRTKVTSRNQTTDSYSISHDYKDLYKKLESEFGVEVGGIWQLITGSVSVKTKIMNETKMTSDDVVVLANFTYSQDLIELTNPGVAYGEFFQSLSLKSRDLYRKYCGDRYTKDVTTGASMTLVFTAKKTDSAKYDSTKVDAAIRVGLMGLFSVGTSANVTTEQRTILNSYSFSTKCYTVGTSADVCGSFSAITAFDITKDTESMQTKISDSRQKVREEAKAGKSLAIVQETQLDYEVPLLACIRDGDEPCPLRWTYFTDYRDRLSHVKEFSVDATQAEDVCSKIDFWPNRCAKVKEVLKAATESCVSFGSACVVPSYDDFNLILTAKNPGLVEVWDNKAFGGGFWGIDFRNMINGGALKANVFYSLSDAGFEKANDKASSLRIRLKPLWTIRFYQDAMQASPGQQFDLTGETDITSIETLWGKSAHDKFSAFKLIPPEDI